MKKYTNIVIAVPHSSVEGIMGESCGWKPNAHLLNKAYDMTEWHTDFMFNYSRPGISLVRFPLSRFVVDVDPFNIDKYEIETVFGDRIYTKWHSLNRESSCASDKALMYKHTCAYEEEIVSKLGDNSLIVNAHAYDNTISTADICIGENGTMDREVLDTIVNIFVQRGYSVNLNKEYNHALELSNVEKGYDTITIAVNKRCYLSDGSRINTDTHYAPRFSDTKRKVYDALLG